jgi:taurine---2-oxoglutarate transaminase
MSETAAIQAKHAKHVLSPWVPQGGIVAPVIDRAEGRYLIDTEGKKYFSYPSVVKAAQEQAARVCYSAPTLFTKERAELAEELSQMSPWAEGARTFFTTAGAEANDDVVRIAKHMTGRTKVMTAYRSFHGSTGTAINLTGEDRRWNGEASGAGVVRFFAPFPYRSPFFTSDPKEECARALDHLERTLVHEDPKRVAAILIEPVVGSNGVIVYPDGYLKGLREICTKHGIMLIFDEVMTGFGRTGAAFASQTFGVEPDMITFAKGVSSAYVPLGGIMIRESLAKYYDDKALPCGHTYSGHAFTMAVGLAAVRAYRRDGIIERVPTLEGWLKEGLTELKSKHKIIGDFRGIGAFYAIELVRDRETKEPLVPWHGAQGLGVMKGLYAELRKRGVFTFGKFNLTMMSPPLTTEKHELTEAFAAVDDALTAFEATL